MKTKRGPFSNNPPIFQKSPLPSGVKSKVFPFFVAWLVLLLGLLFYSGRCLQVMVILGLAALLGYIRILGAAYLGKTEKLIFLLFGIIIGSMGIAMVFM